MPNTPPPAQYGNPHGQPRPMGHEGHLSRPAKSSKKSWTKLFLVMIVLAAMTLFSAGTVAGWYAHEVLTRPGPYSEPEIVEIPVSSWDADFTMPDVRGIPKNDALLALTDLGVTTANVTVTERPWAGIQGVVIEQSPVPGATELGEIELVISAPATVPNLIGSDRQNAMNQLRELGSEVVFEEQFDVNKQPGTVLATSPKASEVLTDTVTVTIASSGGSIYLSQLKPISKSCSTVDARMNGESFASSLECRGGRDAESYEWDLQRKAEQVELTLGVADDVEDVNSQVHAVVYVDGTKVNEVDASFGKPVPLKIPTKGSLRLRLDLSGNQAPTSSSTVKAILGDARVVGTLNDINQLELK